MAHIVYDKAKWHFDSKDFPNDVLDVECGATHIAFFKDGVLKMIF